MNKLRLDRILKELKDNGLTQMLISDSYTIYYLTGKYIKPGERFLGLLIKESGENVIFINELFTVNEDLGVKKVWFSDNDDPCLEVVKYTDKDKALGIDKNLVAKFLLRLMELNCAKDYKNSSLCVDKVRSQKDNEEIALMQEASRVNDKAIEELITKIKPNITEKELADNLKEIYAKMGAYEYSFEPLVGFGKCAAIGHYEAGNTVLKEGDCVLIDMGCVKDGYCSDMTRTFFYKSVSDEYKKLYDIVLKAQLKAISIIKPGVKFSDIDKAARDIITEAGYGENFTHRLGHSIGLECHEFGDVSEVNDDIVKEGMTFSIEPGIYLEGDVGIRIEDLVCVTKDGVKVLNSYSKELKVIE